jgi:hypothetical protein
MDGRQPELISTEPSPEQAEHEAERTRYLALLRDKLRDPEFRAIEGFPIGEDEDILALSDPPYYTACPNPFLPEIMDRWQAERRDIRTELGLPDDSAENGAEPVYRREPFAADVSEGKNDPIYNAHSYHTKVPHKAIMRYILHYTEPGDIIFDGFCGSGMTGVAAQLCGDRKAVESLGYRVNEDGTVLDQKGQAISRLGTRKIALVDLSPAATFIAYNYNTPVNVVAFEREARRILAEVEAECGWMYETTHTDGKTKGRINYTVWSDVFLCSSCGSEIVYWDAAVDKLTDEVRDVFSCPECGREQQKRQLNHATEVVYDPVLCSPVRRSKQVPVAIHYSVGARRFEKRAEVDDLELVNSISHRAISYWFPLYPMMFKGERWGDTWRGGSHAGMTHVHHFYSWRNLSTLAASIDRVRGSRALFLLTALLRTMSRMFRWAPHGKHTAGTSGTLYVPSITHEYPIFEGISRRLSLYRGLLSYLDKLHGDEAAISTSSSSAVDIPNASIDYIFADPPFGANLMYSELNFLTEAWLRVFTNACAEAIVSTTQAKGLLEYERLAEKCFQEFYRMLKPGRWMTIEFHNSQNSVWNAIHAALTRAGFVIADVRTLDKRQQTFKQVAGSAVKQDLVISAYKPRTGFERRFVEQAGSAEGAWAFVRQHLEQLPVVVRNDGVLEVIAERQAFLLYDRMVAFHIQRGFSVPMGATEFYAGLQERFIARDGMYFVSEQVAEYDLERMRAADVEQLPLFVTDERSAIQWLQRELHSGDGKGPQTYSEIMPKFLRELHQARHEKLPELRDLLEESFLQDDEERWYVPDPARQGDLERLRERSLLREFQDYALGKGRLKVFRTEAIRAGFKRAWAERQYRAIVQVAHRLPESVVQEDAGLLMYYDNALMRADPEPLQGQLF